MHGHRSTRTVRGLALLAALALVLAACGTDDGEDGGGTGGTEAPATAEPSGGGGDGDVDAGGTYADPASWLCHPDKDPAEDVCHRDLDATVVAADGTTEVVPFERAEDPAVDCFYVYPTISLDEGANADMEPAEGEEIYTVYNQAARFGSVCEVYAPIYRQRTLTWLTARLGGDDGATDDTAADQPSEEEIRQLAYDDVVAAFEAYLASVPDDRGFVLMGHSQGAGILRELLAEEVEPDPELHDRLVSALLLGTSVSVPAGQDVGSDLPETPLCRSVDQTGCVVTYASFRTEAPPPPNSLFGDGDEGETAGCVNPAAPAGGSGMLTPELVQEDLGGALGGPGQAFADPATAPEITTPWIVLPDLVSARCVSDGTYTWLDITVVADPADPRVDDLGGDLTPEWGLHLIDVNVAMGDLIDMVGAQAAAYAG